MDSTILIRTADVSPEGRLRLTVGSTLVRHSEPESEVAETRGKAAGLIAALGSSVETGLRDHPEVLSALARRNEPVADFWLRSVLDDNEAPAALRDRRILVVDAEDTFTAMLAALLRSMGPTVDVRRYDEPYRPQEYDLLVLGPGPGDPTDDNDERMSALSRQVGRLLTTGQPFIAVCLSHQVLSRFLGLRVARRPVPNQGVHREIDLFGQPVRVGFYNSFAAYSNADRHEWAGGTVEVSRDRSTGEVHALRGPGFRSMQFHAESVLSKDGVRVVREVLTDLLVAWAGSNA